MPASIDVTLKWLATLTTGAAVVAVSLAALGANKSAAQTREDLAREYAVGDRIVELPLAPTQSRAVVLWIDSRCGACLKSFDFYKRLTELPGRPDIIIMGPGSVVDLGRLITDNGILARRVVGVQAAQSWRRLGRTPTVFLIDDSGTIEHRWSGRLPTDQEQDVLATVVQPPRERDGSQP